MIKRFNESVLILFILFSGFTEVQSQVFWNEVTTPVSTPLRCVSNISGYVAWACGANGVVLKTTDMGYTWVNYTGNGIPTTYTLINIFGIDILTAIVAGYSGTTTFAYRTSNGGSNWTQVFTQANGFIDGVWMTSALNGFMVGDPVPAAGGRWSLWKTTNGGINWDSTGLHLPGVGSESGWNSSFWIQNTKIWFGTNSSKIYYSSNYGLNWTAQTTFTDVNCYSICVDTTNTGLAGGNTALMRTTNGGVNWGALTAPGTGSINGVAIAKQYMNAAWYIRSGNTIYFSYYPFISWTPQYTTSSGTYNHIAVYRQPNFGAGMIYAVKSNGGITRGNFIIEGVKILSNEIPALFKVYQNYPNPFNPQTKIKLEVPLLKSNIQGEVRGALIKIKIYDALGREVEQVLDQITQPGVYEAVWNGTNYPSGVYYYMVTIVDPQNSAVDYRETRKMVLLK
ncbi:MAG: hypothetical protein EHM58_03035 [Ignavibacteriae bacterium]|nr:MAG: hypothetical protein EHM58_03035 [Ignavibacteriota bacterium]